MANPVSEFHDIDSIEGVVPQFFTNLIFCSRKNGPSFHLVFLEIVCLMMQVGRLADFLLCSIIECTHGGPEAER